MPQSQPQLQFSSLTTFHTFISVAGYVMVGFPTMAADIYSSTDSTLMALQPPPNISAQYASVARGTMNSPLRKSKMQTHAADEFPKLNVFDQTLNDEFLTKRVFEVLTNKEIEVFALAYKGHLNKNIAVELKSSIRTIDIHRYRIKKKLKLNSQSEIAVLGYRVQKALVNFLPRKRVDLLSIDNV